MICPDRDSISWIVTIWGSCSMMLSAVADGWGRRAPTFCVATVRSGSAGSLDGRRNGQNMDAHTMAGMSTPAIDSSERRKSATRSRSAMSTQDHGSRVSTMRASPRVVGTRLCMASSAARTIPLARMRIPLYGERRGEVTRRFYGSNLERSWMVDARQPNGPTASASGPRLPDRHVRMLVVAVAGSADRADDGRVAAQTAAEASHVHVDGPHVGALPALRPQCVDEVLAGQGASGVRDEGREQVELLVGHGHELPVGVDLAARDVDAHGG